MDIMPYKGLKVTHVLEDKYTLGLSRMAVKRLIIVFVTHLRGTVIT